MYQFRIDFLENLVTYDNRAAVAALRARIKTLKVAGLQLDVRGGQAIAGGAVFRALRGDTEGVEACDLDLIVQDHEAVVAIGKLFIPKAKPLAPLLGDIFAGFDNIQHVATVHVGSQGRTTLGTPAGMLDFILTRPDGLAQTLATFDFRCVSLATDGHRVLYMRGALDDVGESDLLSLRTTTSERVAKLKAQDMKAGVNPVDVNDYMERHVRLGLDLRPETKVTDVTTFWGALSTWMAA